MKRILAIAAVLLAVLSFGTYKAVSQGSPGQQVTSLTGTEQIPLGYPCTVSCFVNSNVLAGTSTYLLVATGTTVTSAPTSLTETLIATGAITTWNITTPTAPFDGERFVIANATGSAFTTNVSLTAASGSSLNTTYTSQTIAAGASVEFRYATSTTKWYRVR